MTGSEVSSAVPPYVVGLLVLGVVALLPFLGAILFIGSWVGRLETRTANAEKQAIDARERCHALSNAIATHQQHVATEYVRHGALEQLEARLVGAIGELKHSLDRIVLPRVAP